MRIGAPVPGYFSAICLEPAAVTLHFLRNRLRLRALAARKPVLLGGFTMVGRGYLSRQVVALLSFARATGNPELAALLVEKAASLKSQADEMMARDVSPKAPDVEVPSSPRAV